MKHGLDPETPVEDIMLLNQDKDGSLLVIEEYDRAERALELEHRMK